MNKKIDITTFERKAKTLTAYLFTGAFVAMLIIAAPFVYFCLSWFVGWLIKLTFGDLFVTGLSLLNLNITKDQLPLFFGTVGVIGSFFKADATNIKKG